MRQLTLTTALLLFICIFATAYAQDELLPMDSLGHYRAITPSQERILNLFPTYPELQEVRLYKAADSSYYLNILFGSKRKTLLKHIPLTAGQVAKLRAEVTRKTKGLAFEDLNDTGGRTSLKIGSSLLSIGFYSWGIPVSIGDDWDSSVKTSIALILAEAGIVLPHYLIDDLSVTEADASIAMYGGTRGIVHGISVYYLLNGDHHTTSQGTIGSGMAGSMIEMAGGYLLSRRLNMTGGNAEIFSLLSDMGLLYGYGIADMREHRGKRFYGGSMLLGSGAGMWIGSRKSLWRGLTRGDARIVRSATLLGPLVVASAMKLANVDNVRDINTAMIAGSGLSFLVGNLLVKDKDFSTFQGNVVTIGTLAGATAFYGFTTGTYRTKSRESRQRKALYAGTAGAVAGFTLLYRSVNRERRQEDFLSGLHLEVSPEGMLALAAARRTGGEDRLVVPLFNLSYRF